MQIYVSSFEQHFGGLIPLFPKILQCIHSLGAWVLCNEASRGVPRWLTPLPAHLCLLSLSQWFPASLAPFLASKRFRPLRFLGGLCASSSHCPSEERHLIAS